MRLSIIYKLSAILFFSVALNLNSHQIQAQDSTLFNLRDKCVEIGFESDSFCYYAEKYKQMADEQEYDDSRVFSREIIVYYYYQLGITDSLIKVTNETKRVAKEVNYTYKYFLVWSYLLSHYNLAGMPEHAIAEAKQMNAEAISLSYPVGISMSEQVLGETYLYLNNYTEADLHLTKAYDLSVESESDWFLLASIMYSQVVTNLALHNYQRVITICERLDSLALPEIGYSPQDDRTVESFLFVSACGRTIAYSRMGDVENALIWLNNAGKHAQTDERQIDFYNEAKGSLFEAEGSYGKAIEAYQENVESYKSIGLIKEMNRFILAKARAQWKLEQYAEACLNFDKYARLQDSLYSANSQKQVNELAVISNLKLIELEKKELEVEIERKKAAQTVLFLMLSLFVVAILVISFIIQNRLLRRLKKSERSLQQEQIALRESKETLSVALEKAESSDKLKSAFLANISHEIRTPLNAIVGFSAILKETTDLQKIARLNDIIEQNSDLLLKLIGDIIDLSRIDAGFVEIENEVFNLSSLINDIAFTYEQKIRSSGLSFICVNPHIICMVKLDKTRISQIMANFINNAIKFTPTGEIRMGYRCSSNEIQLYVKDTGIGIAPENIEQIFDRFYKVDEFTQGTGLGLSVTKAIVDSMQGKIEVVSTLNEGSLFTATIPCKPDFKFTKTSSEDL